jgi:hypothetical protein
MSCVDQAKIYIEMIDCVTLIALCFGFGLFMYKIKDKL